MVLYSLPKRLLFKVCLLYSLRKNKIISFLDDNAVAVLWERDKQEGYELINPKAIVQGQTFTSQGYIINIGARFRKMTQKSVRKEYQPSTNHY